MKRLALFFLPLLSLAARDAHAGLRPTALFVPFRFESPTGIVRPPLELPPRVLPPPRLEPPPRAERAPRLTPPPRQTFPAPLFTGSRMVTPPPITPPRTLSGALQPIGPGVTVLRSGFGASHLDVGRTGPVELVGAPALPAVAAPLPAAPAPAAPAAAPFAAPLEVPANPADLVADFELEAFLRTYAEAWPGLDAHVVILDLAGGRRAEFTTGAQIYPGSVVKLALLATTLEKLATRELEPHRLVQVPAPASTGPARRGPSAAHVTELVRRMCREGDHPATNALLDLVGTEAVASTAAALELTGTELARGFNRPAGRAAPNRMPPADAARLLYRMAQDDLPGAGASSAMRELLARPGADDRLAAIARYDPQATVSGWSGDARMQNALEVRNDVAYVTSGAHRYVIAIYTQHEGDARPWITALALAVHRALAPAAPAYLD